MLDVVFDFDKLFDFDKFGDRNITYLEVGDEVEIIQSGATPEWLVGSTAIVSSVSDIGINGKMYVLNNISNAARDVEPGFMLYALSTAVIPLSYSTDGFAEMI